MPAPSRRSSNAPFELDIDARNLADLAQVLKGEADGKELRKQLGKDLRAAAQPLVTDLRAAIRATPSSGPPHGAPLRQAIAAGINSQVRYTGPRTGVSVRVRRPTLRGFSGAPRRFNQPSFRHPVFGDTSTWVTQVGAPLWFDAVMDRHRDDAKTAVLAAIDAMADQIAARARSRT